MIISLMFLVGLLIGSFLGVIVERLPSHRSIIKGRSYCENCKKTLRWYDLIPVFSYLFLRGKCRYCKTKLTSFYPAIELMTAFLFVLVFVATTSPLTVVNPKFLLYFLYLLLMISSFIVIFFIDLKEGLIPNEILVFEAVLALVWLGFNPFPIIINHLLSGIGGFLFFVAVAYLFYLLTKKEGMGGGDVKMSFVLGLFLGFPGIVISLYLSFIIGALAALILIIGRKKKMRGSLPFGPFLIIGVLLTLFSQNQLYALFLKIFGI